MNKRVLLLTGYTDDIRPDGCTDAYMQEVFDLTLPSKNKYVKYNNYDLMSLRSFGKDPRNVFSDKHIGQLRFIRAMEMLISYDAVMWIDADSLITNYSYRLEDFMDDNTTFVASYDWMWKESFSTGNFIVQKTNNTDNLLELFYRIGPSFSSEQETLNIIDKNFSIGTKSLEHKYLGSTPSKQQYAQGWETRSEPVGVWNSESFLLHITGVGNARRIDILNTHFKNFL
jgi:hypothetical protein